MEILDTMVAPPQRLKLREQYHKGGANDKVSQAPASRAGACAGSAEPNVVNCQQYTDCIFL